jgi:hypothetical protein
MATHQNIYAKSIIRRLKNEVERCPDHVLFFSPYLTSATAEIVAAAAVSETSEIYTTFSTENFATGASSIRTIRRLLESGFTVYHLPKLHAKVLLTKEFASVGSQNLTAGGTRNREASVALLEGREIEYLRRQVARWVRDRKRINLGMVEDMEVLLPNVRKKQRVFRRVIDAADEKIKEQEDNRESERRREEAAGQNEASRARRAALKNKSQALREAVESKNIRVSERISARLRVKHNYDEWRDWTGSYSTLERRDQNVSFLDWRIAGGGQWHEYHLTKRKRYLLMMLDSGKLGWPAMNKTQITRFGTGLDLLERRIGERKYKFSYKLATDEEDLRTWNVEIRVSPIGYGSGGVVIRGYFSLADLAISSLGYEPTSEREAPDIAELHSRVDKKDPEIFVLIRDGLLKPFAYERNRAGIEASGFFRDQGQYFDLRLRKSGQYTFLTAERSFG